VNRTVFAEGILAVERVIENNNLVRFAWIVRQLR